MPKNPFREKREDKEYRFIGEERVRKILSHLLKSVEKAPREEKTAKIQQALGNIACAQLQKEDWIKTMNNVYIKQLCTEFAAICDENCWTIGGANQWKYWYNFYLWQLKAQR